MVSPEDLKRIREKARKQTGPLRYLGASGEAEWAADRKARAWAERGDGKIRKVVQSGSRTPGQKTAYPESYLEYLRSPSWKRRALEAKRAANHRCQVCGKRSSWLDVHHLTYERLGQEWASDLVAVCRACHDEIHEKPLRPPEGAA